MLQIRKLGYALGSEVTGVDLKEPLNAGLVTELRKALLDRIVLCFPGQQLERPHLRAFAECFGELDDGSQTGNVDAANPGVLMRTNRPVQVNGKEILASGGADVWHSDGSFTLRPNPMTFLLGAELPDIGGDTMFANAYMAYDALSTAFQRTIEPLCAIYDYSLGPGFARSSAEQQAKMRALNPPVIHPLVRIHPETGRKALYIGERVRQIDGMTLEESAPLVSFLNGHAVRYEFLYRHRWQKNDVLVWDNRCALHFAVQDYDRQQTRAMMRCSLRGPQTGQLYLREPVPQTAPVAR